MTILERFRLDDRVAIVTGASSGLGVTFARALAEAGADVALGARRVERLAATKTLVEQAGRRAIAIAADIARPEDCQKLVEATMNQLGRVDILVNNAGVATAIAATRETPEQFRAVIDVNLNGCYWMAQAGLPQAAYAASKAGLIGLTRDLAAQWTGRKGIRVNALAPGFFASEMTDAYPAEYLEQTRPRILAGRFGEPEELAAALIFLASPAGGYVTGQTIVVDGGVTIT